MDSLQAAHLYLSLKGRPPQVAKFLYLFLDSLLSQGSFARIASKGDHENDEAEHQDAEQANGAVCQDSGSRHAGIGAEEGDHGKHAAFDEANAAAGEWHNG